MPIKDFGILAPVYVTRKTADGHTASYSLSLGQSLLALFILWINVILWGGIGIWKAIEVIF